MKIIEPSATIIEDELSQLSLYQRIAYCAGVCYQRDPRKTEEEAQAFCLRMVEIGHHSTLEMAVVHLVIEGASFDDVNHWNPKYLIVTPGKESGTIIVTGSIRAFVELLDCNPEWYGDALEAIAAYLHDALPLLFQKPSVNTYQVWGKARQAEPHEIPWQHKHVAVRFIVNRAVSHELVRHRPCSFLQESQRYCRYEDEVVFIRPEWLQSPTSQAVQDRWWRVMLECQAAYQSLMKSGMKPQQARAVLPNSTKTELIAYASLPQWIHMFNLRCSPAADPEMLRVMRPLREDFKQKYPEMWEA